MAEYFANGFALLIGVGQCAYEPWTLRATSRDAEALKLTLTDPRRCGYIDENIRLLTNKHATRERILTAMEGLGKVVSETPNSTLIVFYSGHGWLDDQGCYFLLPHDANPKRFAPTALAAKDFNKALRRMKPSRLLVLLDTCHAEGMAQAKSTSLPGLPSYRKAPPEALAETLGSGMGRAVLSSCRGTETSLVLPEEDLSLFTHHLIRALSRGRGNEDQTCVRVSDLLGDVSEAVRANAKRLGQMQTPFFRADTEDFPIALTIPENEPPSSQTQNEQPSSSQSIANTTNSIAGGHIITAGRMGAVTIAPLYPRPKLPD